MKQYLLKVWMTAALSLLVVGGVWGQTAPTVVSLSPADGATGVPVGTTLSIQFENPIIANPTGTVSNLFIKEGSTILHAYASTNGGFQKNYASTTEITISGNVITVDFPGDLEEGTEYTVEITDGFVYDAGTNTAGVSILGPEGWSFTTESTIVNYPTIAVDGLSPANVATGVPVG
ncbi:MAG: Ig-like domain-containing protein, partial [Bacteroidales bacterium]|nr:Ig-like domain-containing protein [Bacteroidales bacterium]